MKDDSLIKISTLNQAHVSIKISIRAYFIFFFNFYFTSNSFDNVKCDNDKIKFKYFIEKNVERIFPVTRYYVSQYILIIINVKNLTNFLGKTIYRLSLHAIVYS